MVRRLVVVVALVMAMLAGMTVRAQPAQAIDDLVYIIPAAVGGVVAVIAIVAIIMANRSEDEFELRDAAPPPPNDGGLRLLPDCPLTASGRPLLCW